MFQINQFDSKQKSVSSTSGRIESRSLKIAALTLISPPYFIPRYTAFVQRFPEHHFYAIEVSQRLAEYQWKPSHPSVPYPRIVLTPKSVEQASHFELIKAILKELNRLNPDVVAIAGYVHPVMLTALVWCAAHHKAAVLMSDTKADDSTRTWWKELPKQWLLRYYQAALVAGQPQLRYLQHLKMKQEQVFFGFDVVDNHVFHPENIRYLPTPLDAPFFLVVSRFIPVKNLPMLIAAYAEYVKQAKDKAWHLVLCGAGPLQAELEQQIEVLNLQSLVHLPGFLEHDELLPYFANAQCLIHASTKDTWGLVVNEAMAAGLPVLVSKCCGCFEDLVIEGINGFGFDPHQRDQITQVMLKMSSDTLDTQQMGQAALAHIQKFSPTLFAEGLMSASMAALASL